MSGIKSNHHLTVDCGHSASSGASCGSGNVTPTRRTERLFTTPRTNHQGNSRLKIKEDSFHSVKDGNDTIGRNYETSE